MRKLEASRSTRTEELRPAELPLPAPAVPPPTALSERRPAADKIKDALLRWLEEEL